MKYTLNEVKSKSFVGKHIEKKRDETSAEFCWMACEKCMKVEQAGAENKHGAKMSF